MDSKLRVFILALFIETFSDSFHDLPNVVQLYVFFLMKSGGRGDELSLRFIIFLIHGLYGVFRC